MFKPTPRLLKRTEKRLKGWRSPAVIVLRRELRTTDPLVLDPPFLDVLHDEPRRGLPATEAYEQMGLPMQDVLDLRGPTRRPVRNDDLLHGERIRGVEQTNVETLELGIARRAQKTRPQGLPYRRRIGVEDMKSAPKVNPMRYKPPATNYWRHSIYAYNKETMKNLAATTVNANRLIRAYFNMAPTEEQAKQILTGATKADVAAIQAASAGEASDPSGASQATPEAAKEDDSGKAEASSTSNEERNKSIREKAERDNRRRFKDHKTTENRVYVSDRGYPNKGQLRVDVLGKISPRMQSKAVFHIPYRAVEAVAPQITYKHWKGGIGVSVHVHEGESSRGSAVERA